MMPKDNLIKNLVTKDFGVVNEDQQIVEGIVTDDLIDIDGHVIDQNGFRSALVDYLQWGNIRDQHGLPVGKVLEIPDWNKFIVQVVDDAAWKRVKGGLYKGFSIGIRVLDFEIEDASSYSNDSYRGLPPIIADAIKSGGIIFRITKMVLAEVSIVDRPANPRALITSFKNVNASKEGDKQLPVLGIVLDAQKQYQGEIQMSNETNETTQVSENLANTEVSVEKSANEVVEAAQVDEETADTNTDTQEDNLETKFARLEGIVGELSDGQVNLGKQLNALAETMVNLSKALESRAEAVVETETADNNESTDNATVATEDDAQFNIAAADKSLTVDVSFDSLLDKINEQIAKSVEAAVEKTLAAKKDDIERTGGVNMGEGNVDKTVTNTETETSKTKRKATYNDVARAVASRITAGRAS